MYIISILGPVLKVVFRSDAKILKYEGEPDHAGEVFGGFFVACEDAARFFEPADQSLDNVAPPVESGVEARTPLAMLGATSRNDRLNVQVLQVRVDPVGAIRAVPSQRCRPSDWSTLAVAQFLIDPDEHVGEDRRFVDLSGREMKVERMPVPVAKQMDLRRESAARTT